MRVLKISNGPGKKAIFTDAAIHAREWITPPVILKIAFELLENYDANKALVDMVDWYLLPVANPDGYVYSWDTVLFTLLITLISTYFIQLKNSKTNIGHYAIMWIMCLKIVFSNY